MRISTLDPFQSHLFVQSQERCHSEKHFRTTETKSYFLLTSHNMTQSAHKTLLVDSFSSMASKFKQRKKQHTTLTKSKAKASETQILMSITRHLCQVSSQHICFPFPSRFQIFCLWRFNFTTNPTSSPTHRQEVHLAGSCMVSKYTDVFEVIPVCLSQQRLESVKQNITLCWASTYDPIQRGYYSHICILENGTGMSSTQSKMATKWSKQIFKTTLTQHRPA